MRSSQFRCVSLMFSVLLFTMMMQAQTITTIAGTGPNNMPALSANLALGGLNRFPTAVVVDPAGNILIDSVFQNRIFKVDSSGQLTVFAGNGGLGFSGDSGLATSAQLGQPQGMALDGSGNLFIGDSFNNRIRRVDAVTGIITTVAGNGTAGFSGDGALATSAELNNPTGLAFDTSGNLFISDSGNSRIRRVDASTKNISTVAGNGTAGFSGDGSLAISAELSSPTGLAFDSSGNLFIADTNNSRIRRVDATTKNISTVAGNGTVGFSGDGGLATSAELSNPTGLAFDISGNLFIGDTNNSRIRRVDAITKNISTAAGNGTAGFSGDGGPAVSAELAGPAGMGFDSSGNLLFADTASGNTVLNFRIRRVDASTGNISTVAGNGSFGFSGDGLPATDAAFTDSPLAIDSSGNLFIADGSGKFFFEGRAGIIQANHRIRRMDASSGIITTVAGSGTPDENGGFSGDGGLATSAQLSNPAGVAVDSSGNLFIADTGNNRIRRVDASSHIITTVAGNGTLAFSGDGGPATSAALSVPTAVEVDGAGNLFIADTINNRIRRVDASSHIITTVAGNGTQGFSGDSGLAVDAELSQPVDVRLDAAGNLFIADTSVNAIVPDNRIRRVDAITGIITTVAGNGTAGFSGDGGAATSAELNAPSQLAIDSSANLFITDSFNARIRRVDAITGIITTVAGNGTFGFSGDGGLAVDAELEPEGLVTDSSGNLFIGDGSRVRRVSAPPLAVTTTTVISSLNPSTVGQSVTFTATVTSTTAGTPTGTVTFKDGATTLGSSPLNGSAQATLTISTLTTGTHSNTAVYGGDTSFGGSTSTVLSQVVQPATLATTTTTVSSSLNPSTVGKSVTFTATVTSTTAGTPTGSVTFKDGATTLGSSPLNGSAQATFTTSTLAAGPHSIAATYSSDSKFAGSTSPALSQVVQPATLAVTTTTVTSSLNPSTVGQSVTFTATVTSTTAGTPTGAVTFKDGATTLGSSPLNGSAQATFTTSTLAAGPHSIAATYSSDSKFAGSTSTTLVQTVNTSAKSPSSTALTSSVNPSIVGQPVTFTATVNCANAGVPTGYVTFLQGTTALDTTPLVNGKAKFTTSFANPGTYWITATYSGNTSYLGSTSQALSQKVKSLKATTKTVITSSDFRSYFGQLVTFTATVTSVIGPIPNGETITFRDGGGAVIGTGVLKHGRAKLSTAALPAGTHPICADYPGDGTFAGSISPALTQLVQPANTRTTITSSPNPSRKGRTITLTATVTSITGTPTGKVTFTADAAVLGTTELNNRGKVTIYTSALPKGSTTIAAHYTGEADFKPSSASLTQKVN